MAVALVFPVLVLAGVWFGLDRRCLALVLAALVLARWGAQIRRQGALLLGLAAALGVWLALKRADLALKAYPICINLGLLAVFAQSLRRGPSVIGRLAELRQGPLDERGVRYTRSVTKAWCLFFGVNAALSLATAWLADERLWAIYNGAVSYVLMGLMFAGEWLVRQRVLRKPPGRPVRT